MLAPVTSRWPCPCCGHLTLPDGPGAYELCPVCFWEDDLSQLRWPMRADGANGTSLVDAQQNYERIGAMDRTFRQKVRSPRSAETLDPGWRAFDPDIDWTHPELPGERWPANSEALYYWRPTYWNGDPHRTPVPPREPTGDDRLVQHLLTEVPEIQAVVDAVEWQYGEAAPMAICARAADMAIGAYREGTDELGLRIACALNPGLDESSELYAPTCVSIGFLENDAWHDDALGAFADQWPDGLRAAIRKQQANVARWRDHTAALLDLWKSSRGEPIQIIEDRLRDLEQLHEGGDRADLPRALMARVMSDPRWGYKHPLAALALAWRYRSVQSPLRTVSWLLRPRFAG